MLTHAHAPINAIKCDLSHEMELQSLIPQFVKFQHWLSLVCVDSCEHLVQRPIVKVALKVQHVSLIIDARLDLVYVGVDLVV